MIRLSIFYGGDLCLDNVQIKYASILFIGKACCDLILTSAGIMTRLGYPLRIIDLGKNGHLFQIVSGYGGRTGQTTVFRGADYIRCESSEEVKRLLENRRDMPVWIYCDLEKYQKELSYLPSYSELYSELYSKGDIPQLDNRDLEKKNLKKEICITEPLKKILISDSYYPHILESMKLLEDEQYRQNKEAIDLFVLRGNPGRKISFLYLCRVYAKQLKAAKQVLELAWAEEDYEYFIRLGYEPSQGFFRLSSGYKRAVEEICLLAGAQKRGDIKKQYHSFEKNK